jgi:hypothetical protein
MIFTKENGYVAYLMRVERLLGEMKGDPIDVLVNSDCLPVVDQLRTLMYLDKIPVLRCHVARHHVMAPLLKTYRRRRLTRFIHSFVPCCGVSYLFAFKSHHDNNNTNRNWSGKQ